MAHLAHLLGQWLAGHLSRPRPSAQIGTPSDPHKLLHCLRPGDVLLVEGSSRFAAAIKYLTQSSWSHAALYVGPGRGPAAETGEPCLFIEADILAGVCWRPLTHYLHFHTRVCRARHLQPDDLEALIAHVIAQVGNRYDLKNIADLARYLLPHPPVPPRWRRHLIALGSGDPTRAICSSLIAEAFQRIGYPVLPFVTPAGPGNGPRHAAAREIYHIRHHSLYAPRDFDVSPYFEIVKPTLASGFDYRRVVWDEPPAG